MDKVCASCAEAVADIPNGSVIAIPGFFAAGVPRLLLRALIERGVKNLTLACGCGPLVGAHEELITMVKNGQVKKVIDSYGLFRSASKGLADPFEQAIRDGTVELEVYPMGTLAEKYRAAGAGIPAFYTPTGIGSVMEETVVTNIKANRTPKETKMINGQKYILEYALQPDYAFIHANIGDRDGNLRYRKTARNFNPVMAMAARYTIAEVENLVEAGGLDPDMVHTPSVFVKRVVPVDRIKFRIGID
uniref:Putative succinyl-CoA:3-ketoacid coenzyme A transferase subunit A n=1 Tax=uncultured Dehalococcoidia bacterium TaxID=498747 RepID=A0A871XZ96_9CHLR|nr:putative succinyl-CoA:3-ketoacid coenzyme A transferase subunit A [uncultured Dehalococcoidia bacterium]